MLNSLFKIVAGALMLLLLGQPLAACMTSGPAMTVEEHNCCMKMATMCENSAMPASHSCCKHPVTPQAVAASKVRNSEYTVLAALRSEVTPTVPTPRVRSRMRDSESPPEGSPKISNILRI